MKQTFLIRNCVKEMKTQKQKRKNRNVMEYMVVCLHKA